MELFMLVLHLGIKVSNLHITHAQIAPEFTFRNLEEHHKHEEPSDFTLLFKFFLIFASSYIERGTGFAFKMCKLVAFRLKILSIGLSILAWIG